MNAHLPPPKGSDNGSNPAARNRWRIICLVLLASAWGLGELIGGETVVLTAVALFLLAMGRALINRAGTSTAMAAIAVLFKSVNTAPFLCHLAGIALLGLAFDLTATLLWRDDHRRYFRAAATGVIGAYLSTILFAVSMVWIIQYRHWVGGGIDRVVEYVLTSGSRGALTGLVLVPAGLWLGSLLGRRASIQPRIALRAALATCLLLWALGPFIG